MKWPFILALCALFFLLAVLFTLSTTSEEEIAFAKQEPEVTAQSTEISSNAPLVLTDEIEEYQLGLHLEILEDPSTQLTFDQVSSPEYDSQFKPSQVNVPNYGYTASAYWVRATLDNETSWVNEWLLEVGFANTHYVDLYYPSPDGDGYVSKQSGVLRPLSTRDVIYPKIVFDLTLLPQTQGTVYLRFQSGASMTIPLTLWTKDAFIGKSGQELILHWLLFGGFVALLIYHLFLLITLRELTYLYFVAMLVSMLMVLLEYLGYMGVYIFPDLHNYKLMYGPFLLALMNVSILLFSDNFLELRVRSPISHWVTVGFLVIWLLLIILIPVVSYLVIARLMIPTQLITIMATWVIGIVSWRRDFKSLRYFMVAWLGMAASLFWLSLVRLGIASSTNFSENMFQWGFIVMAVSWSFALAYRINLLKTTTENTARDLQKSERRLSQILEGLPVGVVVYGKDQKPAFINRWTVEMLSDPTQGIRPDISAGRTLEQAIDQFSFQVAGTEDKYPLEGMPVYRALHGEPASADDIAVNIKDGQVLLEVWASPIKDGEGKVESAVATIQDITSRKKVEAELEEHRRQLESLVRERTAEIDKINRDLQLRLDWLSMINKVHQRITGSTSLTQVYTDLSAEVLSLLEADLVVILRWDGHIDGLGVVTNLAKGVETLDENILYESFEKNSPLRKKIETFTPIIWSSGQSDPVPASIWDWFIAHNICDAVFTPMFVGQSVFGVLGVAASATQQNISIRQFDFVERVALDLSNLAQDADLLDKTMALVAMDERNRLAKDLHDSVTQVLFTATLLAEVLPQIWQKNPEQGLQSLEKLRKLTKGALAEMRTMLIELRPSAVLNTSLSELLAQLTEALTSRIGVQFRLFIEQVPILPDDVQVSFYRIAQEALNNVGKHAQALSVEVSLSESELPSTAEGMPGRMVRLVIQDDGVGFYPDNVKAGHMGIAIMRERANAIGADLLLKSEPGHGTIVSMTWRSDPEIGKQDG